MKPHLCETQDHKHGRSSQTAMSSVHKTLPSTALLFGPATPHGAFHPTCSSQAQMAGS
ncbi:unnamed protein product, partial [Gulo gulo]